MKLSQYIQFIQEQGKFEIYRKILDFFRDNPSPSDVEVHDFAEKLGIVFTILLKLILGRHPAIINFLFKEESSFKV